MDSGNRNVSTIDQKQYTEVSYKRLMTNFKAYETRAQSAVASIPRKRDGERNRPGMGYGRMRRERDEPVAFLKGALPSGAQLGYPHRH
jgi:hypothetical protein